ncbi:MAG: pilus assembly protein N-terminal domain-containing protein [Bacillota bacterium]|nr:pilus assembly protein N-terminal domain-containing protein [Bacillota bacterium]
MKWRGSSLYLAAILLAALGLFQACPGQAAQGVDLLPLREEQGAPLVLPVNTSRLLALPPGCSRVAVGNPAIADVTLVAADRLLVNARQVGTTNLLFWGGETNSSLELQVVNRWYGSPEEVEGALGVPGVSVRIVRDALVLEGVVAGAGEVERAEKIALLFAPRVVNLLKVKEEQPERAEGEKTQIRLKVKVIELQRSALREIGLEWPAVIPSTEGTSLTGLLAKLKWLESAGKAKFLAEPSLIAVDGGEAVLTAGGEVPVPMVWDGNPRVEWKGYGVQIFFHPRLCPDGRIAIRVKPEVSSLDWSNGTSLQGSIIPALRRRAAETSVVLRAGSTMVISGLFQREEADKRQQVPLLGRLPLLGELFRVHKQVAEETELLILVTVECADSALDPEEARRGLEAEDEREKRSRSGDDVLQHQGGSGEDDPSLQLGNSPGQQSSAAYGDSGPKSLLG